MTGIWVSELMTDYCKTLNETDEVSGSVLRPLRFNKLTALLVNTLLGSKESYTAVYSQAKKTVRKPFPVAPHKQACVRLTRIETECFPTVATN